MIKAVIFDCFGVLIGTGLWSIYERAGGDLTKDKAFLDDILDRTSLGQVSSQELSEKIAERLGITYEQWRLFVDEDEKPNEDVFEYIRELKPNHKIGLLTNARSGTPRRRFTREQLALFDSVIVSAEVGIIKPDPRIFELAAKELGVKPEETMFTDDNAEYLAGARQVGMHAHQFISAQDLRKAVTEAKG